MKVPFWVCASALFGCSRVSAPPPPSASVAQPPTSAAPVAEERPTVPTGSATAAPVAEKRPTVPTGSATAAPSQEPPVAAAPVASTTAQAKEEFRVFVAARQRCSAASQCTIVPGSCPFGCFIPVAKASAPEVVAKLDALGEQLDKAGNRCVYRCMSPPAATCVDGRCSSGQP